MADPKKPTGSYTPGTPHSERTGDQAWKAMIDAQKAQGKGPGQGGSK